MSGISENVSFQVDREKLARTALQRSSRIRRPFLRWAGSKQNLLPQLVPYLPSSFSRYYEPFLGAGALALLLAPSHARLNDVGVELMRVWMAIAEDVERIIDVLDIWDLNKDKYYELRSARFSDPVDEAARFIYLNRGAFNGLYRVNKSGDFNVPWGAPKSKVIVDPEMLRAVSVYISASDVVLSHGDFESVIDEEGAEDFIFADPPYLPIRQDGRDFVHYNHLRFDLHDQRRLAESLERARLRGAYVLTTNSSSSEITDLYPSFQRVELSRKSTLAASASARTNVTEILFSGSPLE